MSYQYLVTLKQGSKTDTQQIEAQSLAKLQLFLSSVTTQKVSEIKEIVYNVETGLDKYGLGITELDKVIPLDDADLYHDIVKAEIQASTMSGVLVLHAVPKTILKDTLVNKIKDRLLFVDQVIINVGEVLKKL